MYKSTLKLWMKSELFQVSEFVNKLLSFVYR